MKDLRIEVEREYTDEPSICDRTLYIAFRLYNGDELISETKVDPEIFEHASGGDDAGAYL
jgi:hypothetical protein